MEKACLLKILLLYHLTPVKKAEIKNTRQNNSWGGCGEKRKLPALLVGCKLV